MQSLVLTTQLDGFYALQLILGQNIILCNKVVMQIKNNFVNPMFI